MDEIVTTAVLDEWVRRFAHLVAENRDYLTELDAAIGDADHGSNMDRGMKAAVAALDASPPATAGALFSKVGMTLVSTVGGASGPLFGTLFLRIGSTLGDAATTSAPLRLSSSAAMAESTPPLIATRTRSPEVGGSQRPSPDAAAAPSARWTARAASIARRTWSSWVSGAPNSAIKPSPVNWGAVPP